MQRTKNSYKKSGVNIDLADKFVKHIAKISKKMSKKRIIMPLMITSVLLALPLILAKLK